MDKGAWQATVQEVAKESDMILRLKQQHNITEHLTINDVLELTAKERLLVDSGGIYFQLLLSMIMHAVYLTSLKSPALVAIYVSSAIMALINLIPNKGSDGYWMVKDAFGIEDVVQNAKGMIGKSPLNERKKKVQAVLLVAFRNMSIVYLLILILTVFIYALHTITADVAAIICQITALEALRIIWNRLGCLVAIAVVLQNVIASIGKSGRDGRSALEEKGKVR